MIYEVKNPISVKYIFENWEETLIWSCLQKIMGKIYVTRNENPVSAMAIIGDFIFFGGEPDKELAAFKPEWCDQEFIIMIPHTKAWNPLIEQIYGEKAKPILRYATKKENDNFDKEKLKQITASLPAPYELCMIDEKIYKMCKKQQWSYDLVSQFKNYDVYKQFGLGVVIRKDGEILSGASSYSRYDQGIEIEIDTKKEYRRKGLASICGAKLILECLGRNLYPSWDAHNQSSLSLAEKLGYHFSHEYEAYEIRGY